MTRKSFCQVNLEKDIIIFILNDNSALTVAASLPEQASNFELPES